MVDGIVGMEKKRKKKKESGPPRQNEEKKVTKNNQKRVLLARAGRRAPYATRLPPVDLISARLHRGPCVARDAGANAKVLDLLPQPGWAFACDGLATTAEHLNTLTRHVAFTQHK